MFRIKNPFKKEKAEKIMDFPSIEQPPIASEVMRQINIETEKPKMIKKLKF